MADSKVIYLSEEQLQQICSKYDDLVEEERLAAIDLLASNASSCRSVLTGLLTRQVFFARQFAQSPGMWTIHIAPAFFRCMYELNVRIMWILEEPELRSKAFIKSSMKEVEQVVKSLEKASLAEPHRQELKDAIMSLKGWLVEQETLFKASEGGKFPDVRSMAEKLGGEALKMYRLYNSSLSPAVHSSWSFISQVNLQPSSNPLHRNLPIPSLHFDEFDPDFLMSAAYFANTALQAVRGTDLQDKSAYKQLEQMFLDAAKDGGENTEKAGTE